MNPAKNVTGARVHTALNPCVSTSFTVLGPRSLTWPSQLSAMGTRLDQGTPGYSAAAAQAAVVDNEDGTFTYTPPDETSAHGVGIGTTTGDTVSEVEVNTPDGPPESDAEVAGPFGTIDHPRLGVRHGEHVFFYRVPTDFAHLDSTEIHGATNGTVGGFGTFEVHPDPQIDVFGDVDHGDRLGREFGLAPGDYIGFVYEPFDLGAAYHGPTTDTLYFTAGDGTGSIRHCASFAIEIPAMSSPAEIRWSPRSRPNDPSGSIDVTRLDAFCGSTYLPTGEVVFEVSAREFEENGATVTFTQPAHGTLTAFGPHRVTLTGGLFGDTSDEVIRLVYTPSDHYRTDPTVYTDGFSFEVDDGLGSVQVTTVPVLICKKATLDANGGEPYLGTRSFSGRVAAPFADVRGYLAVSSALLAESIGSMIDNPWSVGSTLFGSVEIDDDGAFTYTRDPDWADLPVDEIDDSFAVIAYTAENQWAAAVVPVGGRALTAYPPIIDLVNGLPTSADDA